MFRYTGSIFKLTRQAASEWFDQDLSRLGAALAFYALFAVAPLFVMVLALASLLFGADAARAELFSLLSGLIGSEASGSIKTLVIASNLPKAGAWQTVIAGIILFIGATGLFVELQDALNSIWGVRRVPGRALWNFIKDRLLSMALIAGIGALLLLCLLLSMALSSAGRLLTGVLPAQQTLLQQVNFAISFLIITLLFAMIFKLLPDVKIPWRDVWMGAILTALLFSLGQLLLIFYLATSDITSLFGAAGSLVVMLLWVFYSAQILFIGAKFTQVYTLSHEARVEPAPGAQVVTLKAVLPEPRGPVA